MNQKIKNPLIVAIREQLEHRALWMYLLCDEAKKKGIDSKDYAPDAIKRCGLYQGANLRKKAGGGDSLKGLKKTLFSKFAQWVFKMDIKQCTDDHLDIDFHGTLALPKHHISDIYYASAYASCKRPFIC